MTKGKESLRLEVRGLRRNDKCQSSNVKTEIQMTNNGVKNTSTKLTDTDTKHEK